MLSEAYCARSAAWRSRRCAALPAVPDLIAISARYHSGARFPIHLPGATSETSPHLGNPSAPNSRVTVDRLHLARRAISAFVAGVLGGSIVCKTRSAVLPNAPRLKTSARTSPRVFDFVPLISDQGVLLGAWCNTSLPKAYRAAPLAAVPRFASNPAEQRQPNARRAVASSMFASSATSRFVARK